MSAQPIWLAFRVFAIDNNWLEMTNRTSNEEQIQRTYESTVKRFSAFYIPENRKINASIQPKTGASIIG